MKANFDKAIAFTLGIEGGYSNDLKDPGGETKFGISKRSYPNIDIRTLTFDDAKAIYQRDFWEPLGCDNLPFPIDCILFDTGVNMGTGAAKKLLESNPDPTKYLFARLDLYTRIKHFNDFGRGWTNRVIRLYKAFCNGG